MTRGLWRWRPGRPEYTAIPDGLDGHPSLGEEGSRLLVGTDRGIQGLENGRVQGRPVAGLWQQFRASRQPGGGAGTLRDRDGAIWIATRNQGLVHFHQGRTDKFSEADGLSGDSIIDFFEDREGNVWVVTTNGIDRFRDYAIPSIGVRQGLSNTNTLSVLAARDDSVWIATYSGVNRSQNGRISVVGGGKRGGALDRPTYALFQDSSGRIWVSTLREFGYLDEERFVPVLSLLGNWLYSAAEVPSGASGWRVRKPACLVW